jgi:TetR/AcrR family transcriptional regulator, acrAB operon repressor
VADSSEAINRPTRMTEIGDESRRRILDAAEKLFIARGVSATSFSSIEREAGISRGSIPWHFKNKTGLLMTIVQRATVMNSFAPPSDSGRQGLHEVLARSCAALKRPQAVLLASLIAESIRVESPTHEEYRAWHENQRAGFASLVESDIEELPLPDGVDADTFAAILFGTMIGIHLQSRLAPDRVDLDRCFTALGKLLDQLFPQTDASDDPD